MTAANLMKSNAGYINTGAWSDKAIKEAKRSERSPRWLLQKTELQLHPKSK